jgi:hypothetical protein
LAVYRHCFLRPQELPPSTTYLVRKVHHLQPFSAKFWCIPSTCLYQEELLPSTTLLFMLAQASAVYHIAFRASTSFCRLPLLLAPTRGSAVYHCFSRPQEVPPSTTYLVMKVHLEPLRAKFLCIPISTCLYQEGLPPSTTFLLLALAQPSVIYHIPSAGASMGFRRLLHCFWR